MKIIAVDIGNSATKLAVVENAKVESPVVLANEHIDHIPVELKTVTEYLAKQRVKPVVICSVAASICEKVVRAVELATDAEPFVIGDKIPLPLALDLADPETVGHDRVVAAAMAYARMENAVVVADFGTAVTIDCVNADGVFLGGAILPGLKIGARGLASSTAALPLVDGPAVPATPWGRDTREAIATGLLFGAAGALREIVERYATELGSWPEVILTGGDAAVIAKHCDFVKAVVPELLLMGIGLAYERYRDVETDSET